MKKQVVWLVLSLCLLFGSAFKAMNTTVQVPEDTVQNDSSKTYENKEAKVEFKKGGRHIFIDSTAIKEKIIDDKIENRLKKNSKYIGRMDVMENKLDNTNYNMYLAREQRKKDSVKISDLEKQIILLSRSNHNTQPRIDFPSEMFYSGQFNADSTGNITVILHKNDVKPALPTIEVPAQKRGFFKRLNPFRK